MAAADSLSDIWKQIELSESYLVSSMYDDAVSIASSVLKLILHNNNNNNRESDMVECAGMVLVQSLYHLGRVVHIFDELKLLFDSLEAIPVEVLLTGACFQINEGSTSGLAEVLDEFLSQWKCVDGKYYAGVGRETDPCMPDKCDGRFILGVDKYMEVVEFYTVTLLGTVLKELDLAISWVEKAALPEDRQQELLRRLHSLCSLKATNPLQDSESSLESDYNSKEKSASIESMKGLKTDGQPAGEKYTKEATLKLFRRSDSCFWWFRSVNLRFGKAQLVLTNGKIVLGLLAFLVCYIYRRKRATVHEIIKRQVLLVKKSLVDLWQLAFSYQVNPLAAVQPLPVAAPGSR